MQRSIPRKQRVLDRIGKQLIDLKENEAKERLTKQADIFVKVNVDDAYKFAVDHIQEVKALPSEEAFDQFMGSNGWKIDNINLGKIFFAIQHNQPYTPPATPAPAQPKVEPEKKVEPAKAEPAQGDAGKQVETASSDKQSVKLDKFWVVTKPTAHSELNDILFESTLNQSKGGMELQFKGGLTSDQIVGIYTEYEEAKKEAEKLMNARNTEKANAEHHPAAQPDTSNTQGIGGRTSNKKVAVDNTPETDVDVAVWFEKAFGRTPQSDPGYFKEWQERWKKGPRDFMSSKFRDVFDQMKKEKNPNWVPDGEGKEGKKKTADDHVDRQLTDYYLKYIKEDSFGGVYSEPTREDENIFDDCFVHIIRLGMRFEFYLGEGKSALTEKDVPRLAKVVDKAIDKAADDEEKPYQESSVKTADGEVNIFEIANHDLEDAIDGLFEEYAKKYNIKTGDFSPEQEVELGKHIAGISALMDDWFKQNGGKAVKESVVQLKFEEQDDSGVVSYIAQGIDAIYRVFQEDGKWTVQSSPVGNDQWTEIASGLSSKSEAQDKAQEHSQGKSKKKATMEVELSSADLEYIAKEITRGFTSGKIDGDGWYGSWDLDVETWREKESSKQDKKADETKIEEDPATGKKKEVTYKDDVKYVEPDKRTIDEPKEIKPADESLKTLADKLKGLAAEKASVDAKLDDIIRKAELAKEQKAQELGQTELANKIIAMSKKIKDMMDKAGLKAADLGADILALSTEMSDKKKTVTKKELTEELVKVLPAAKEAIKTIEDNAMRVQTIQEQLTRYPKTKEQKSSNTDKVSDDKPESGDIMSVLGSMYEAARNLLISISGMQEAVA